MFVVQVYAYRYPLLVDSAIFLSAIDTLKPWMCVLIFRCGGGVHIFATASRHSWDRVLYMVCDEEALVGQQYTWLGFLYSGCTRLRVM